MNGLVLFVRTGLTLTVSLRLYSWSDWHLYFWGCLNMEGWEVNNPYLLARFGRGESGGVKQVEFCSCVNWLIYPLEACMIYSFSTMSSQLFGFVIVNLCFNQVSLVVKKVLGPKFHLKYLEVGSVLVFVTSPHVKVNFCQVLYGDVTDVAY